MRIRCRVLKPGLRPHTRVDTGGEREYILAAWAGGAIRSIPIWASQMYQRRS